MTDKVQLQKLREIKENPGALKDIRGITYDPAQPAAYRMKSFIAQGGNPYRFKVGSTVVEVGYEGSKSFNDAVVNMLISG